MAKIKRAFYCLCVVFLLSPDSLLSAGENQGFSFSDILGREVNLVGGNTRSSLVLFINQLNSQSKTLSLYAQVIFNKYSSLGLKIVCVTRSEKTNILDFIQRWKIEYPIILDPQNQIKQLFDLCNACNGLVLLNDKGRVIFRSNSILDRETIRQLIEGEFFQKINYRFPLTDNQTFHLDRPWPEISLFEVSEARKAIDLRSFNEDTLIITFFSSFCGACKSGKRVKTLEKLKAATASLGHNHAILIVFTEPVEPAEIQQWNNQYNIPFEKYLGSDVFSNEEKYITMDGYKADPLTIALSKERKVIFIEKAGDTEDSLFEKLTGALRARGEGR